MPLKHKIAKAEEVPAELKSFYEAGSDGAFYLQVEGMVPKTQVDEFRNNNIALMQERDNLVAKYKDIDPVKYTEYKAAAEKTPAAIEEAVVARVTQMKNEHTTVLTEKENAIKNLSTQLSTVLVDGSLKGEAVKAGILPTAVDDVVLRGRMVFSTDDKSQLIAKNSKGEKLYGPDGTSPLTVTDWVKDLKKTAPHLFQGMNGGGGQGQGGRTGPGGIDMSKATPVQKIQAGLRAEIGEYGGNSMTP